MALEEVQKLVSDECKLGHISSIKVLPDMKYKNLKDKFEWTNIPMFAVITGRNGVGKSSLLEAFRESLIEKRMDTDDAFKKFFFETFVSRPMDKFSKRFAISASCMPQVWFRSDKQSDNCYQVDQFNANLNDESIAFANYCVEKTLSKHDNVKLSNESFRERFDSACQTFDFTRRPDSPEPYFNWILAELQHHWKNTCKKSHLSSFETLEAFIERLYFIRCDWSKLNNFLTDNGFQYHIVITKNVTKMPMNPAVTPFFAIQGTVDIPQVGYHFEEPRPLSCTSEQYIPDPVTRLSPGEEIQLVMLLWRYDEGFTGRGRENGIMLLDEPDAHLHPSLVSDLINAYRHEFVTKQGVQVILTTHNPTTVSMVDKENIFVMSKENGQATIRQATSKEEALRCLLPPHIGVHDRTRVVFVNSDEDEIFFDVAYQVFKQMTNPKIGYRLLFTPLRPSGITTGAQVVDFVNRLTHKETSQSFSDCVFGIVVATSTNHRRSFSENSNVFHLRRGNVLSYIYDPVHLYFVFVRLAEKGKLKQLDLWSAVQRTIKPKHADKGIISILCGQPEEHNEALQLIVNEMTQLLKTVVVKMTSVEKSKYDDIVLKLQEAETTKIEFRNSSTESFHLEYPTFWLSVSDDISQLIFDQFVKADSCCKSKEEFTKDIVKYCCDQVQPSMMFPAELGNIFNTIQGE